MTASSDALFFDFDGLLCDTESAARRSWCLVYEEFGLTFPAELWNRMQGRSDGEDLAVDDLGSRLGRPVSPEERARRKQLKFDLAHAEPLRPGVMSLVEAARAAGAVVAVVSSSPRAWLGPHLDRLDVADLFAFVVCGDDEARHKPAPDLYRHALARADVAASHAVAFEDSATGVRAAKAAGLRCVAVPSAVGTRSVLGEADLVLDSLTEYRLPVAAVRGESA